METGEIDLRYPPSSRPSTAATVCAVLGIVSVLVPPGVYVSTMMVDAGGGIGDALAPLAAALSVAALCGIAATVLGLCAVLGRAHAGWVPLVLGPLVVTLQVVTAA